MARLPHQNDRLITLLPGLHWRSLFGLVVVCCSVSGVLLFQGSDPAREKILGRNQYWIRSLVFSPDGKKVAAAGGLLDRKNELVLWDVASGQGQTLLLGEGASIEDLAFSPNGRWLALIQRDQAVKILDAASGAEQASIASAGHWQQWLLFSPDSKELFMPGAGGCLVVWDLARRTERHFPAPGQGVFRACRTGLLFVADHSEIGIWDVTARKERGRIPVLTKSPWSAAALSPDGDTVALASSEGSIAFFSPRNGRNWSTAPKQRATDPINSLAFSPDGQTLVSGGQDHAVRLWNVSTGEEIALLGEHEAAVFGVDFAPDGRQIASGGFDRSIHLWNTERLEQPARQSQPGSSLAASASIWPVAVANSALPICRLPAVPARRSDR
jgi:WD40 repeat protein